MCAAVGLRGVCDVAGNNNSAFYFKVTAADLQMSWRLADTLIKPKHQPGCV